jgi:hypothetical protein
MTQATILHEAEVELWEAVVYYEERAAGLGLDFEAEVKRSVQTICESRSDGRFARMALGDTSHIVFPSSLCMHIRMTTSGSLPLHTANEDLDTGQIDPRGGMS